MNTPLVLFIEVGTTCVRAVVGISVLPWKYAEMILLRKSLSLFTSSTFFSPRLK
nr:MAG TPA: hypothetical protein [Caudoviricetes sp.]